MSKSAEGYRPHVSRRYNGREVGKKPFYVFFFLGCALEGKYDVVFASSMDKAKDAAKSKYGTFVASVKQEAEGIKDLRGFKYVRIS